MNIKDLDSFEVETPAQETAKPLNLADLDSFEVEEQQVPQEANVEEENNPSVLESFLRGGAQGATFDFSDELEAGAKAAGNVISGDTSPSDYLSKYEELVGPIRDRYKKAADENPKASFAGNLGGGITSGLLTGGAGVVSNVGKVGLKELAKQGAKIGAKQGALQGLGASEGLMDGDVAGTLGDVATGATAGAAIGGLLPVGIEGVKAGGKAVKKGLEKAGSFAEDIAPESARLAKDAFDIARQGIGVVGKKAEEKVNEDSVALAENILKNVEKQYKSGSKMVSKALSGSDKGPTNVSSQMRELESAVNSGKVQPDDLERIQNLLDQYKRTFTKETVSESGMDKALNRMQKTIDKARSEAEALGETFTASDPEIKDGFLQSILSSSEEIAPNAPKVHQVNVPADRTLKSGKVISGQEKAEQALQKKLNRSQAKASMLGEDLTQTQPSIQNNVLQAMEIANDVPTVRESSRILQTDIPEDVISREVFEGYNNMSIQDLQNLKSQLGDLAYSSEKLDAGGKAQAAKAYNMITEVIEGKIKDPKLKAAYESGNKKMSDIHQASELFGEVSPQGLTEKNKNIFAEKLKSNTDKNSNMLDSLSNLVNDEGKDLIGQAEQLATRKNLSKTLHNEGGFLGGLVSPKAIGIRAGATVGNIANKVSSNPSKFSNKIMNLDNDMITNIANKMSQSSSPEVQEMGRKLANTVVDSDKKGRLIWALSQQPAFRQALLGSAPELDEE